MGTAAQGEDISIEDINAFKSDIKDYLIHYEGLANAQKSFSEKLNSVDVRKEALILLLRKFVEERITALSPDNIKEADNSLSLTQLINKYYTKDIIQKEVDLIIEESESIHNTLKDNRLRYPDYTINQAKFIRDEIYSLGKEYIATYRSYQESVKAVLIKSSNIGDIDKINAMIKSLEKNLSKVESSFNDAINIQNINTNFYKLVEY